MRPSIFSPSKRFSQRNRSVARTGVASLEFVMSFPILVLLIAMLFTLNIAAQNQTVVTTQVRHRAWEHRTDVSRIEDRHPFRTTRMHDSGTLFDRQSKTVTMFRNWFPTADRTSSWGNTVLAGSWDYREVPFRGGFAVYPHIEVLGQMARAGVESISDVDELFGFTQFPGL